MQVNNTTKNGRGLFVKGSLRFVPAGQTVDLDLDGDDLAAAKEIEGLEFSKSEQAAAPAPAKAAKG